MTKQKFGGQHTEQKLAALEAYLQTYAQALKKQPFRIAFFDGFAGTGKIELPSSDAPLLGEIDAQRFIEGSAQRALRSRPPFHQYIFVERSRSKAKDLKALRLEHSEIADRIHVKQGDANDALEKFCRDRDWDEWRAVVFLDPYGNQVSWRTLKTIAETEAIDLWYLFPAGPGVHRQISGAGTVDPTHEESLDRLMGTKAWRAAFVKAKPKEDLFDRDLVSPEKTATVESITVYMIERMKTVFRGGVLDEWLSLSTRGIKYSLIFASANPDPKVWPLASRLAKGVLRSTKRGRVK